MINSSNKIKNKDNEIKEKILVFSNKGIIILLYIFSFFSFTSKSMTSISGGLIIILGMIKFFLEEKHNFSNNLLNKSIIIFLVSIILSGFGVWSSTVIDAMSKYILLGLLYFVIIDNLNSKKEIKNLIWLVFISITIAALYGLYQHYYLGIRRVSGFMLTLSFGGILAFFLVYIISFISWGKIALYKKLILIFPMILFGLNLFLNQSKSAWIGMVVGLFFLILFKNRKIAITLIIILLILAFLLPANIVQQILSEFDLVLDRSNRTRLFLWESAFKMWADHPINGVGIGRFQTEYINNYKGPNSFGTTVNAHNNFLQFAAVSGTIGFLSFVLLIFAILKYLYDFYNQIDKDNWKLFIFSTFIAMIVFNIQGLANVNFLEDTSIKFFWFWIAIHVSLKKQLLNEVK